ncbi:MAG: hypothetical protein R6W72_09595 [Desulfurivibrionaceae bacterium]
MLFLRFLMNPQKLMSFTALQATKQASFSTAYISFGLFASPAMALFLSFARPLFLQSGLAARFWQKSSFQTHALHSFHAN